MASFNPSDMYAKRVFQAVLRSGAAVVSRPTVQPQQGLSLAHLASLSTYDKPAAPTIEENSYYDKYKEKLERIKQAKPDEYESALEGIYGDKNAKKEAATQPADIKGSSIQERMKSSSSQEAPNSTASSKAATKKGLNDIIKLDLLEDKSAEEISAIWSQFYATKEGVVFATIPVEKYNRLKMKGNECPLFIYAVPRAEGYEFMLGQCSKDDWYYTPLIAYQTHGEYAPYSLHIQHFTELADSKGLVLMKGEIASEDLKPELATLLAFETQLMYGSDENFEKVKVMHERPNEFKHMDVIDVCKKAGLF